MKLLLPILLLATSCHQARPPQLEISGRLTHPDGEPAADVQLEFLALGQEATWMALIGLELETIGSTVTRKAGHFASALDGPCIRVHVVAVAEEGERVLLANGWQLELGKPLELVFPSPRKRLVELRSSADQPLPNNPLWIPLQGFGTPVLPVSMPHRFLESDDFGVVRPDTAERQRKAEQRFRKLWTDRAGRLSFTTRLERPELVAIDEFGVPHCFALKDTAEEAVEVLRLHEVQRASLLIVDGEEQAAIGAELWVAASSCWGEWELLLPARVEEGGKARALMEDPDTGAVAARWNETELWQTQGHYELDTWPDEPGDRPPFVLQRPRDVVVAVTGGDGLPLSGVSFEALASDVFDAPPPWRRRPVAATETAPGIYRLEEVIPYATALLASRPGSCSAGPWGEAPQESFVGDGPDIDAFVELHIAVPLEVRVLDAVSGLPAPGAWLDFKFSHWPVGFHRVDENGVWKGTACSKLKPPSAWFWGLEESAPWDGESPALEIRLPLDLGPPPKRDREQD